MWQHRYCQQKKRRASHEILFTQPPARSVLRRSLVVGTQATAVRAQGGCPPGLVVSERPEHGRQGQAEDQTLSQPDDLRDPGRRRQTPPPTLYEPTTRYALASPPRRVRSRRSSWRWSSYHALVT